MMRVITIPTDHPDIGAAVEALAPEVNESTVRITASSVVGEGAWVRFAWLLRDGTMFWEGVGRCRSCVRVDAERFTVELTQLSFDARNEVMHERVLLGLEQGRRTGEHAAAMPTKQPPPIPDRPRYSSVPPAPKRKLPPPPPPAKLSSVVKAALRPKPGSSPSLRPVPPLKPGTARITGDLAERARTLSRQLNLAAPSLARGRWTEERVLEAALRMGIEALEGLVAARDASE